VLDNLQITSYGASRINANFANYGDSGYNPDYDLDANGAVTSYDSSLLNMHLNASFDIYQDTYDWVWLDKTWEEDCR
jgi:hypothetical protein